jgi:CO/xanthine dehydrogenase Mo-binding subunit
MNDASNPIGAIGGYVPMVDGPKKVTGAAKFTADFRAPATLCGRIFRGGTVRQT